MKVADLEMPPWAIASPKRREHIARVVTLALEWADAMKIDKMNRDAWRDAATWHDALRDAGEAELRAIVPHLDWPASTLHGPATAAKLAEDGERRSDVLEAIFWHTIGKAKWERTGRMLYMADYLEPGRKFEREARAALAAKVASNFDRTFRDVVELRLAEKIATREKMLPETLELWESVQ